MNDALKADHSLLNGAVREAGALALDYFRKGARSWEKEKGHPVTEADLAVNDLLHERLAGSRPGYGWLSEETADNPERLSKKHVWIVDPIDGTRAFMKGLPEFSVCAALVEDGKPVLGAVFNPASDEFFEARLGQGTLLNGKRVVIRAGARLKDAHFLTSERTFKRRDWPRPQQSFRRTWMSSIAYRMAIVASGRFDVAISLAPKSDWDIAAADLIMTEAGALCTDREGKGFTYNQPVPRQNSVVGAAPALHAELLAMLAEHRHKT